MKKLMSILLAVMLAATLVSAVAFAEEESYPQPEGGKKFESNWAIPCGMVEINYEEAGYRVFIDLYNMGENAGAIWEYNCLYNDEKDVLEAISAIKRGYSFDPETFDLIEGENEYELFLEEGMDINFTINADGKLVWNDSQENAGADLEFQNIGNFEGRWVNEEEGVWTEIAWLGHDDEDTFWYDVYIHRDGADGAFTEFLMHGFYNPETAKLECMGTATHFTLVEGAFVPDEDDGESYDAFFSKMEDGTLLFETANGIELEYEEIFVNEDAEG